MMDELIVQKKTLNKLASKPSEVLAQKPSEFSLNLLKKYGWKEGEGLGIQKQGNSTYITVAKKNDTHGVGLEANSEFNSSSNNWWEHSFKNLSSKLKNI